MRKTPTNWTGRDDTAVENMIRSGASRRDLLRMLMASGVTAAAGGSLLMKASTAVAQTPTTGGTLRAAGWSVTIPMCRALILRARSRRRTMRATSRVTKLF